MSQPSSSSIPTSQQQQQQSTKTPSIPKKIPPIPWAHIETVNLIEAYQEKWYSLKRGQLKASQWEEVASAVASRCGFKELSKTATQCRHKMEKLRKRYRTEKQRGTPIVWVYFDMMDRMERGPFPLSARPISSIQPSSQPPLSVSSQYKQNHRVSQSSDDDDEEEEDNEEEEEENNKLRSLNNIIRRPPMASPIFDALPLPNKYGGGANGGRGGGNGGREGPFLSKLIRSPVYQKPRKLYDIKVEEEEEEDEEEVEVEGEGEGAKLLSELASVVRAFGEGFVKVETMKLEMMKEAEKHRIEMEKKRMEMIQESQRRIVDAIAKTFESNKKPKMTHEDS